MNANQASTVRFENVTKRFDDVVAIDDISFEIEAGSLVTLLGPSGCGKTTTLRLIAGLDSATEGNIYIGDQNVTTTPVSERDISMVFQSYALFPHMSVIENVAYGLLVKGVKKDKAYEEGQLRLGMVGLDGYGARLPSELSGGQQQRVAVARALILEPAVLLFDEPLSNLDAKLRRRVRSEIRELQQQLGLTTVYVTHDQEEALAVSDRIIVMNQAKIAQDGTPLDLYESPASRFVADFIGDANILDCEVISVGDHLATVKLGDHPLELPHRGVPVGSAQLGIRPEAIRLKAAGANNSLTGEISKATYLGDHVEYTITTSLGELFSVEYDVTAALPQGTQVDIDFTDRGVTLLGRGE